VYACSSSGTFSRCCCCLCSSYYARDIPVGIPARGESARYIELQSIKDLVPKQKETASDNDDVMAMLLLHARKAIAVVALAATSRASFRSFSTEAFLVSKWSRSPSHIRAHSTLFSLKATTRIGISDAFDGGNIQFVETKGSTVLLRIKPDPYTELEQTSHSQHFHFRSAVSTVDEPLTVKYVIENASEASYAQAWKDYTVFFSKTPSDPNSWTRKLDTTYENGQLSWTHQHLANESVYFSYFPPFSHDRHLNLISKCKAHVESLGQSLDGREIECVTVGSGPKVCWIIHRQHPGESMSEFYAEGLLQRLLGFESGGSVDGLARRALQMYTFYVVPNMCPDGSVRGHLRTNACGANLNREWAPTEGEDGSYYEAPTMERSPEVHLVLKAMDKTGVDAFLDVHGDEELPFNFLAGGEGCPNWGPRLQNLQGAFLSSYTRANSDMQQNVGYDPEPAGQARLNTCSNQIATRFDCLAVTLEMPFKDCLSNPDPERGWSPARARMLGASVLDALVYVHPFLRDETKFWNNLPEEDAYVEPSHKY
jgi:murein tripeptide amidase MpaA